MPERTQPARMAGMTMNQIKTMNTSIQCLDSILVRLALACIAA